MPGFARKRSVYTDGQNPFRDGTARFAATEKKPEKAFAQWIPDIPETGKYAVYVSYQTLPGSVSDAKYLVFHKGGVTEFKVNQQMGGGTWVYLGTFEFDKGTNDYGMVVLSNESKQKGVVCADAVRFDKITYHEVLVRGLQVMDSTATALCQDNRMPILVLNIDGEDTVKRALSGEPVGTLVYQED